MFGKKAQRIRDLETEIAALQESLNDYRRENAVLSARVQNYEARELSIARALTEAAERAEGVVSEAQRQAGEILEQSQADSDAARRDAEQLVDNAYQNARDIVREAEGESRRRMDETQAQIETYVSILTGYDRLIQENIRTAEENAKKFAELGQRLHASIPQILSAEGKLIEAPDGENPSHAAIEAAVEAFVASENADEPQGEKLWTVSELSKIDDAEMATAALIDGVIAASEA